MKVKKFVKLEADINLSTQKEEFLAICEEFGSNFPSLRIGKEGWESFRKFVLGDENQLPLIQKYLEEQTVGENNQWAAEINIRMSRIILFYETSEDIDFVIAPFVSRGNDERILKISKRIFRTQVDPVVRLGVGYEGRPSLAHKDGYVRLYERLKNLPGWVDLTLEEVEISEEDRDYYLSQGVEV